MEGVKKGRKPSQYAILQKLRIINDTINVTNVKNLVDALISGLINKFPNTNEFCNNDINKFSL